MSPIDLLNELARQGIVTPEQQAKIVDSERERLFSLREELRYTLYAGILLLSSGLGLLVYDNFDQIGHGALLVAMAIACVGCFAFAWINRPPWTTGQTVSRSTFGDYALILACLLFLTLEGYAQYTYTVFGNRYGLVTLLPAVLFLPLAYRFDHRGVLSMALTALISWVGVTVRPLQLYFKTNFFDQTTVYSAIALALVLISAALMLAKWRIKAHFSYTYLTIAGNLLLVALLGGLFNFEQTRLLFALGLLVTCVVFDRFRFIGPARYKWATSNASLLFLLMSAIYGYIGITYLVFHYFTFDGVSGYYWYFILTGIGFVAYLLKQLPNRETTNESV